MSRKHRNPGKGGKPVDGEAAEALTSSGWTDRTSRPRWKPFPGPRGVMEPARLCFTRRAYADLLAHGKESLEVEVCGVLLGRYDEDEEGLYVSVEAAVPGRAAREGGTHVTFTQETWNAIHAIREQDYPKLDVVGWYHTHPGFGVDFSEMDLFIQRNFFSRELQVAHVSDPLGGEEAVCVNTSGGVEQLSAFWIDGKERRLRRGHLTVDAGGAESRSSSELEAVLHSLETRISQLSAVVEGLRQSLYRFLLVSGMVVGLGMVGLFGYGLYLRFTTTYKPPETVNFASVPVQIGDKTYLFGVQVVRWQMPERLVDTYARSVRDAILADEELSQELLQQLVERSMARSGSSPDSEPPPTRSPQLEPSPLD
jgi:proteasome lid subunit RPN8/RPN11